jgi:hypothetical protein
MMTHRAHIGLSLLLAGSLAVTLVAQDTPQATQAVETPAAQPAPPQRPVKPAKPAPPEPVAIAADDAITHEDS